MNLRAPATTHKQAGSDVLQVHWTPIFCRGKLHIHVCVPSDAQRDPQLPAKLNNSADMAKFVRNVLPKALADMKRKHGWRTLPHTLMHDKASYYVNGAAQVLNPVFAGACAEADFQSWLGDQQSSTEWLCGKWGDVYVHETVISHIRLPSASLCFPLLPSASLCFSLLLSASLCVLLCIAAKFQTKT